MARVHERASTRLAGRDSNCTCKSNRGGGSGGSYIRERESFFCRDLAFNSIPRLVLKSQQHADFFVRGIAGRESHGGVVEREREREI